MDAQQLIQDSYQFATKAVQEDTAGHFKVAIFFYLEAAEAIKKALDYDETLAGAVHEKAVQYLDRAESLHRQISKISGLIFFIDLCFVSYHVSGIITHGIWVSLVITMQVPPTYRLLFMIICKLWNC